MIKQTVQKKSSNISLENTKDIALSIQFSLDGFSFCITDNLSNKDLYFTEYEFEETQNSPEDLLEKIKQIFKSDSNLQLEFSKVTIIHQNNLVALVPDAYFNKNTLAKYLNYNIKTLKTDFITYDEISEIEAKIVYIPYVNINNYLFQNFGEFEFKHHYTVLLEKFLQTNKFENKVMHVNVSKKTFDVSVFNKNKLVFINSFAYNNKEDFMYYILFTAEQLELKTDDFKLLFSGDINVDAAIYKIAFKYIKNISFLESRNSIFNNIELNKHSNYILLG